MQCQPSTSELTKFKDELETVENDVEKSVNENSTGKHDEKKEMTEVSAAKVGHFYSS